VSGARRGAAVEGEVPRDQIATPAEALAPLTSQLAALMPEPPRSTTLLVAVNVDGATVNVDEQEVGESPLAPGAINPGEHTVTVGRTGYLVQSQRIDIARGQQVRLNFDLAPTAEQAAAEALAGGALGADAAAAGGADGSDAGTSDDDGGILTKWWLWAGVGGVVVLAVLIGVIAAASGGNGQLEAVSVPPIMP
ncbi:MAG: PEGA domain-containing protein, partial [Deltaproteobacteria bacterium]|nr:PEGA domain-containing protein [Deltaproteobacteria bacterium]